MLTADSGMTTKPITVARFNELSGTRWDGIAGTDVAVPVVLTFGDDLAIMPAGPAPQDGRRKGRRFSRVSRLEPSSVDYRQAGAAWAPATSQKRSAPSRSTNRFDPKRPATFVEERMATPIRQGPAVLILLALELVPLPENLTNPAGFQHANGVAGELCPCQPCGIAGVVGRDDDVGGVVIDDQFDAVLRHLSALLHHGLKFHISMALRTDCFATMWLAVAVAPHYTSAFRTFPYP